jgi:hypothetical protein
MFSCLEDKTNAEVVRRIHELKAENEEQREITSGITTELTLKLS